MNQLKYFGIFQLLVFFLFSSALVQAQNESEDDLDENIDDNLDDEDLDDEDLDDDLDEDLDDDYSLESDDYSDDESDDDLELDFSALGEVDAEDLRASMITDQEASFASVTEDWTRRNMELFEIHGYFRIRPAFYSKFYIRNDPSLFPLEADREIGCEGSRRCRIMAGSDMRFLLAPTINLSEEVRINSELIFFDNLMMGSTPSYRVDPNANTVATGAMLGHAQGAPPNSYFTMRRAWGEMESALGILRFGRMPSHFGLGMLYNSGDGLDDDFGDSVDRISFTFKLNGWMITPAFDFPNEGLSMNSAAGRPFDFGQLDDAYRLVAILAYQHEVEDQLAILRRGDWLINTGLHFAYRAQGMSFEWTTPDSPDYNPAIDNQISTYDRDMWMITPDFWFQFLYDTFHFELELAFNIGKISSPSVTGTDMEALDIFSFGAVTQVDYGLLSDQLRIGLEFGIASGDKDVKGLSAPASFDQTNNPNSTNWNLFSFNRAYKVDNILYRNILGSINGTYYFNPWLRYDFLKAEIGKQLGLQLDIIFSRAWSSQSTISGNSGNLGLEIDAKVDFATGDNFHASLGYGVLFPLKGFKGTYEWTDETGPRSFTDTDLTVPQTLRLIMGITF